MIRLLPRTSDGGADLGLKSLDPWNTSESCESGLPNESEPCSPMPGGEQQIWHFCMLFFFSEHQQLHVLMSNPCGAVQATAPYYFVKTKNAIRELQGGGTVETRVDNEIAVQNLTKMANQKGYGVHSEKISDNEFKVTMTVNAEAAQAAADSAIATVEEENCPVIPAGKKNIVVVISSNQMGSGEEELGKSLLKGFIYALSQQDTLPSTILFYNSGAYITSEESASIEDLKSLEAQGVEILTCGTCLNFYGLTDKLQVGEVTNMYVIAEKMTQADLIVQP